MLVNSNRTITVLAVAFLLVASTSLVGLHPTHSSAQSQSASPMGIIIPLYSYPGSVWTSVIQAKEAYPNVPFIVVISPDNGPGSSIDPNFVSGIQQMQAAGITVAGYVDTEYTGLSLSAAEQQVSLYSSWYNVNAIMFDCMSNNAGDAGYYSTLNSYTHSIGIPLTIGNPGATVPTSEAGLFNLINIYESPGLPSLSSLYYAGDPASEFSLTAYGVSLSTSYIESAASYVGYIYLTDQGGSNPYAALPSYFTSEVALLSSMDGSDPPTSSSTSSSAGTGNAALTVNSVNSVGNTITGYYTELYTSSGSAISSSYTPSSFSLDAGATYQIEADSYGACTFSYWSGGSISGSTTDPVDISISSATRITAVYTGSSCGAQTGSGSQSSSGTSKISVSTVNSGGSTISGYYIELWQNGAQINHCYSSCSFTVKNGQTYQIFADSYGSESFNYWQNNGATGAQTVSIPSSGGSVSLTAVYSP